MFILGKRDAMPNHAAMLKELEEKVIRTTSISKVKKREISWGITEGQRNVHEEFKLKLLFRGFNSESDRYFYLHKLVGGLEEDRESIWLGKDLVKGKHEVKGSMEAPRLLYTSVYRIRVSDLPAQAREARETYIASESLVMYLVSGVGLLAKTVKELGKDMEITFMERGVKRT